MCSSIFFDSFSLPNLSFSTGLSNTSLPQTDFFTQSTQALTIFFNLKGLYNLSTGSRLNKSEYPSSNYFVSPLSSASFFITPSLLFITINIYFASLDKKVLVCKLALIQNLVIIVNLTKVRKSLGLSFIQIQS